MCTADASSETTFRFHAASFEAILSVTTLRTWGCLGHVSLYILRKYLCLPKKVKLPSSLILGPFLAEPIWQEKSLFAAKRSRLWQHCAKVKPCRCFCGGSTNVKNAAGKLPAWATQGSQHLSCPGVCGSQELWQHSCLINIFARETIVGFPSYVGTPKPELSVTLS